MSLKVPRAIQLCRDAVDAGKCVVIGLQTTGESGTAQGMRGREPGGTFSTLASTTGKSAGEGDKQQDGLEFVSAPAETLMRVIYNLFPLPPKTKSMIEAEWEQERVEHQQEAERAYASGRLRGWCSTRAHLQRGSAGNRGGLISYREPSDDVIYLATSSSSDEDHEDKRLNGRGGAGSWGRCGKLLGKRPLATAASDAAKKWGRSKHKIDGGVAPTGRLIKRAKLGASSSDLNSDRSSGSGSDDGDEEIQVKRSLRSQVRHQPTPVRTATTKVTAALKSIKSAPRSSHRTKASHPRQQKPQRKQQLGPHKGRTGRRRTHGHSSDDSDSSDEYMSADSSDGADDMISNHESEIDDADDDDDGDQQGKDDSDYDEVVIHADVVRTAHTMCAPRGNVPDGINGWSIYHTEGWVLPPGAESSSSQENALKEVAELAPHLLRHVYKLFRVEDTDDVGSTDASRATTTTSVTSSKAKKTSSAKAAAASHSAAHLDRQRQKRMLRGVVGQVVAYLSAERNDGMDLWHVVYDDGDEEDMEEHEVRGVLL